MTQEVPENSSFLGARQVVDKNDLHPNGRGILCLECRPPFCVGHYINKKHFHYPSRLDITPEGWIVWHTPEGIVALCQFGSNILIATDTGPRNRAACRECGLRLKMAKIFKWSALVSPYRSQDAPESVACRSPRQSGW